jgi:hypothetical protein
MAVTFEVWGMIVRVVLTSFSFLTISWADDLVSRNLIQLKTVTFSVKGSTSWLPDSVQLPASGWPYFGAIFK